MNSDFSIIPLRRSTLVHCFFKRYGARESLGGNIIGETSEGGRNLVIESTLSIDYRINTVCNIESTPLSKILNPVDKLSGSSFLPEGIGKLNIESDCKRALCSNEPSGHILGRNHIVTWIEDYNSHFSQRNFEVQDGDGRPIGYARTIWMVIDLDKRTGVDIASLSYIRDNVTDHPCPIEPISRLRQLTEGRDVEHDFGYVECDFNRHVNTVRYLELMMNQFDLSHYDNKCLQRLEMAFVKETRYGEHAVLRIQQQSADDWRINIMVDGADHVRARLRFAAR